MSYNQWGELHFCSIFWSLKQLKLGGASTLSQHNRVGSDQFFLGQVDGKYFSDLKVGSIYLQRTSKMWVQSTPDMIFGWDLTIFMDQSFWLTFVIDTSAKALLLSTSDYMKRLNVNILESPTIYTCRCNLECLAFWFVFLMNIFRSAALFDVRNVPICFASERFHVYTLLVLHFHQRTKALPRSRVWTQAYSKQNKQKLRQLEGKGQLNCWNGEK